MRARSARRAGEDAAGAARSPRPDVPGSPEDSPHRPAGATSSAFTEPACLRVDPGMEILAAVEDPAADAEATWSGAEVPPVAEGGDGGAEEFGGFGDGEQVGLCVGGGLGHGCLLGWANVRAFRR